MGLALLRRCKAVRRLGHTAFFEGKKAFSTHQG